MVNEVLNGEYFHGEDFIKDTNEVYSVNNLCHVSNSRVLFRLCQYQVHK